MLVVSELGHSLPYVCISLASIFRALTSQQVSMSSVAFINMRRQVRNQQQSHSQSALSVFFRSVGLDTLNTLKSKALGCSTELEPKKFFETTSLSITFQRCAVHLLPCTFSIF